MKINTKQFKEALGNTLNFVQLKSTLPINTYLVFKSKNDRLVISANSQEGLTSSYLSLNKDNGVNEEFEFMVTEAQSFSKIINAIKTAEFNFLVHENLLTIKSGRKEFKLGVIDYESSNYEKNDVVTKIENVNFDTLQQELAIVNRFASSDELRPVLCGVNINEEHIIATNMHYLYKINNETLKDIKEPITLDYAFINKLSKVKNKGFVNIIITAKTFTIQGMNFVTTTRLIDGDYPNYKAILPRYTNSIIIDKLDFTNSLKDATIASDQFSQLGVIETKEDKLAITSRDIDFAREYSDEIELIEMKGDDIKIGFKISLMLELLAIIDDQEIVIQYGAHNKALILYGKDESEEKLGLIMPMNI